MTIMYLTFGEKTEFHVQAYLSMLSFRRQMQATDRLVMITTAPQFYRHCASWVEVVTISDAQVQQWQGEHQFFWRAKIKAIEWVSQRYPADDVLYLDCDTVLYGSIDSLRRPLQQGCGLMDENEGHPSRMKTKSLRMWHQVKGHTYGGITLGLQHNMYRAGVVGIPHSAAPAVVSTALTLCDGMLANQAERIVIEQYSLSVALFEKTQLQETCQVIAHYWAAKDCWVEAGLNLIARCFLTDATPEEELQQYESLDFSRLPVYVYKSNTARRLKRQVARLFPDRDHRYLPTDKLSTKHL